MKFVPRKELQLVGISSMLIAGTYEEIWAPEAKDFICVSDNAYTREKILTMDKALLGKLEWYLTVPTWNVFLTENVAFYLAELGMLDYNVSIANPPYLIAASAVYAARLVLEKILPRTDNMKHHTGYAENQLRECRKLLINFSKGAAESKLRALFKKYSAH